MKIIRYLDARDGIHYAAQQADGSALRIDGNIFGDYEVTLEIADVQKLLAPIEPAAILCIGLNYRQHAAETGAPLPNHPVLFMKQPAAVQHPGGDIEIPTHLVSGKVDFEGELAI